MSGQNCSRDFQKVAHVPIASWPGNLSLRLFGTELNSYLDFKHWRISGSFGIIFPKNSKDILPRKALPHFFLVCSFFKLGTNHAPCSGSTKWHSYWHLGKCVAAYAWPTPTGRLSFPDCRSEHTSVSCTSFLGHQKECGPWKMGSGITGISRAHTHSNLWGRLQCEGKHQISGDFPIISTLAS